MANLITLIIVSVAAFFSEASNQTNKPSVEITAIQIEQADVAMMDGYERFMNTPKFSINEMQNA